LLSLPLWATAQESAARPLQFSSAWAAASTGTAQAKSLPLSYTLGFETVHLGAGEHLGLVGGGVLFETAPGWWAGPTVYGAATGERGGFFVLGGEVQRRWALGPRASLVTGFYAGGGGGGAAPVGDGLMLRPSVGLMWDFGPLRAGLSYARIRFPSGQIDGSQVGLQLSMNDQFHYFDADATGEPGSTASRDRRSGFGVDRMMPLVGRYSIRGEARPSVGLVGTRAERTDDASGLHWGIETAAAAKGDAAGYMEVLGTLGWDTRVTPRGMPAVRVGVRTALGLGGGGAIPTGGGLIGKAALTLDLALVPGWHLGLEQGQIRSFGGSLQASATQIWLGAELDNPQPTYGTSHTVRLYETSVGFEHVLRATRADGSQGSLDLMGFKLNRYVDNHLYVTGQAHSAFAGGAGAYSVGLVGAGLTWPAAIAAAPEDSAADNTVKKVRGGWRFGTELLVGAAGGGRVSTSGGAIVQGTAWASVWRGAAGELRIGAGAIRSLHGNLRSPLVEVNWTIPFGAAGT
jgi:hypothetical protein